MPEKKIRNILIVDDDRDFGLSLADILESRDYRVEIAHSERAALEKLEKFDADVSLVDIRLGQGSGINLIKSINNKNPELLCIMMTAYAAVETAVEALQQGAYDYLRKPFNTKDLLKTLDRCFEKLKLEHDKQHAEQQLREKNEKLEEINQRLRSIVESSRKLVVGVDFEQMAKRLLEEFARNMAAEGGSVYAVEKKELVLIHTFDPEHAAEKIPFPLKKHSIINFVLESKKPLLIRDIEKVKDLKTSGWPGYKNGSLLVIPIPSEGGRILSILTLHNKSLPPFTEQDKEIGLILASYSYEALRAARSSQQLVESEKKYRRIFENIQDVYYETDLDGVILEVSPSVESVYKYKTSELMGKSVYDYFEDQDTIRLFVNDLRKNIPVFDKDVVFRDKGGSLRPCSLNMRLVFDQAKKPSRIIGSLRDKTESHKLEEQLRHAQKIEAIGRLAGGVAHDFNNILTVINGYSEFMLGQLDDNDPMAANLREVIQAVGRAEALTRQLLAFSRKQILKPVVLSINDTIRSMEKMLKRLIGEDVQLVTDLSKDIGNIKTDPGQIEQVIMNLAVNARDAMPRGGKLTIRTAEVNLTQKQTQEIAELEKGPYIIISLQDSGIGVDKETQSRIFEPFFTTKELSKGTGLGLSTVYGIIKQSGGAIFVESEPGKGALFTIYLPRVKEAVTERLPAKTVDQKLRGEETILIVEDEDNLRHLICESLRSFGYNILDAAHGGNALLTCEKYKDPIHLILTDVVMPQMSGAELVERLMELHPEMQVLYMSGYTDDAIIKHGIEHKQTDFIQKPFKLNNLVQKIRTVLDKKS